MDRVKLANFLIELRKEKALLQNDIAELFMVSPQAVSKWERGESIPDIEILERIAKFYNISIEELLNGERKKEEAKQEQVLDVQNVENKRIKVFNIIFSSIFLGLLIMLSFLPFFEINIGNHHTLTNSLYQLIFVANSAMANVLMLLAFLCFAGATIIDIVAASLKKYNIGLLIVRNFCAFVSLGVFVGVLILYVYHPVTSTASGSILITILNSIYSICLLCFNSHKIEYQNKEQKNNNSSLFIKLAIIFALIMCENFVSYDTNYEMFLLSLLSLLPYIGVSIAMYFAKNKKVLYILSIILNIIIIVVAIIGYDCCYSYQSGYAYISLLSVINLILLITTKSFKAKYQ